MAKNTRIRSGVVIRAVAIFVLAMVAHVLFWYFVLNFAPSVLRGVAEVIQTGRSSRGTVDILTLSDQLTVVVMRWGLIPIFIGAIGDLTPYYIGYAVVVATILALWVRRRS
jgi:hypothetical protein